MDAMKSLKGSFIGLLLVPLFFVAAVAKVAGKKIENYKLVSVSVKSVYYDADMRKSFEETNFYSAGESGYSVTLDAGAKCRLVKINSLSEG